MGPMGMRDCPFFRTVTFLILAAFAGIIPVTPAYPEENVILPPPGQMIQITHHFEPPQMIGLKINLKNPFSFDFIMDRGERPLSEDAMRREFSKIVKYFMVALAMPNKEMWVNLSPYESSRIIPPVFGQTEMGRDLLAQDYILKQFTASLIYPESQLGKKFWNEVYKQAQARFGSTDINVNTFNKVWIMADKADIYQKGDTAFLLASHLKVMLEQDFMAIDKNKDQFGKIHKVVHDPKTDMASQIVRQIIVPAIQKEVNEGISFATVRQIYNAEIMATWFKKTLRKSLLGEVFADKGKVGGQKVKDPQAIEKIYLRYLRAYKRGVFNYIKDEETPDGQIIPRKYFSGGAIAPSEDAIRTYTSVSPAMTSRRRNFFNRESGLGGGKVRAYVTSVGLLVAAASPLAGSAVDIYHNQSNVVHVASENATQKIEFKSQQVQRTANEIHDNLYTPESLNSDVRFEKVEIGDHQGVIVDARAVARPGVSTGQYGMSGIHETFVGSFFGRQSSPINTGHMVKSYGVPPATSGAGPSIPPKGFAANLIDGFTSLVVTPSLAAVPATVIASAVPGNMIAANAAQAAGQNGLHKHLGGINLSDEHLTLNIKVDGKGMPLPVQFQNKAMMNISGLVSVIKKISPVTPQNVPALFSLGK